MNESIPRPRILFGLIGAAVGGFVGYRVFGWMLDQGFYALIIPAGFLGLAGGYCVRSRSIPFAIVSALAGLALGLFTEWHFRPFAVDGSLLYFIKNLHKLTPTTLVMVVIGAIISYRLALGMDRRP